jgi:hypothetical protein
MSTVDEEHFEAWLDAWCVAWAHIGEWHVFVTACGQAVWVQEWYQRGVMMGLHVAYLSEQKLKRLERDLSGCIH